ncbi:MAG TPA: tetratricopeptide repeat protein [Nitrospiria bacterium]|jgi:putative thioredoxin
MTPSWIENVTETDFEEKVVAVSQQVPVLVDFWAPWCGPCRTLGPILEQVIDSLGGKVHLAKVNTDENPTLAQQFQIQGIPAVKAVVNGEIKDEFVGVLRERQIREFIEGLVPSEADRVSTEAQSLEEKNPGGALKKYEDALQKEPSHAQSLIGKLRVLVALGRLEEAEGFFNGLPGALQLDQTVSRLKTKIDLGIILQQGPSELELREKTQKDPHNLEALWDLAIYLSAEEKYSEAFEIYLTIMEKDRAFKDDGARKAVLQLFELIGSRSPLAETYRDKMARLILS